MAYLPSGQILSHGLDQIFAVSTNDPSLVLNFRSRPFDRRAFFSDASP
jgi:hypothetical protein